MWISLAILVVVLGGLAVLLYLGAKEHRATEIEISTVRALSLSEAEEIAVDLLKRPGVFETQPATAFVSEADIPQHVAKLFESYRSVRRGEFCLSVDVLREKARVPGFTKIGEDFEFTEILVRANDERVFVSYGDGPRSEEALEAEKSIWHEIIIASGTSIEATLPRN